MGSLWLRESFFSLRAFLFSNIFAARAKPANTSRWVFRLKILELYALRIQPYSNN